MTTALRLQNRNNFLHASLLGMMVSFILVAPEVTFAASCPSSLAFKDTAKTECPSYNPSDPTTVCAPDAKGHSYQGQLTQAVLAGCDPPITLRPDSGVGKISNNLGSITQGGKCPPPIGGSNTPTCPSVPGSQGANVAPASTLNNPFDNLPSIPLGNGGGSSSSGAGSNPLSGGSGSGSSGGSGSSIGSIPSLPCGGGVPLLNQLQNIGSNLNVGSVLSLGNINIGMPPVNLPNFNITVPSLSMPSLSIPSVSTPNIPLPSIPDIGGSISSSIPNIGGSIGGSIGGLGGSISASLSGGINASLSCPSINLPNFSNQFNISAPNIQLPNANFSIPSMSIPSFNLSAPDLSSMFSIPNIPNLPNFDIPSLNIPLPSVPNFGLGMLDFSTPMPSLTLPTISLPSLTLPSINISATCSANGTFGSELANVNNLLSSGLLTSAGQSLGGLLTNGLDTITNQLSTLCPGSTLQLSQTGISLVLPPINLPSANPPLNLADPTLPATATSLSPPIALGSQAITYPSAGAVYNLPINAPIAFNVNVIDDLILPNGGATISPQGTSETLAGRSMVIVITPGPWDQKSEQVVVGTDVDVPITSPFPATTNRSDVKVSFPNSTINGCTYTNNGDVLNGVLDMSPFWRCPSCGGDYNAISSTQCKKNNSDDVVNMVFTLAPFIQDYSAIPATAPNIEITTSAIVMNASVPPSTVPSVAPPAGSFLSIPDNTPITFNLSANGTLIMPAGGSFIDPSGNTVDLGQDAVLQTSGNGQLNIGYALKNADGSYNGQITLTGTTITYPAGPTGTFVSVSTSEIEVPAGATLPVNISGTIATPQGGG